MATPRVKLADLLGKRKEKEVLMNYQKTKNCRDKKKMEERAAKKREASKLKYLEKSKDKVKCLESIEDIWYEPVVEFKAVEGRMPLVPDFVLKDLSRDQKLDLT